MQNSRIQTIDLIKVIAMICVMGLHCAGVFVSLNEGNISGNIVGRISVCAIPLFFMVSGYLLLGRNHLDLSYSITKIIHIIKFVAVCTFSYTLIFWIWRFLNGYQFDYLDIMKNFIGAFIKRGAFSIFWYFGAMIIIYLIYPYINRLFINNFKSFVAILLALCFFEFIVYTQQICHTSLKTKILQGVLESSIPQTFRLWNWLFYFILGGVLKKEEVINFIKSYFSVWTVIILGAINICLQMLLLPALKKIQCEYFYSAFFVIAYTSAIFINICSRRITNNKFISEMSKLFLPVYAFHMFVIQALSKMEVIWNIFGCLAPFVFWIIVSVLTITISYFFIKIPLAKKLFTI